MLQGATVGDLKKAIEQYVVRKHNREGNSSFISWYINDHSEPVTMVTIGDMYGRLTGWYMIIIN